MYNKSKLTLTSLIFPFIGTNKNMAHTRNEQIKEWRQRNPGLWNAIIRRNKRKGRVLKLQWVKNEYARWRKWCAEHPAQRRKIARDSYNRNKVRTTKDA